MKTAKITCTGREFAIGKIVCLARNYAEHARELGNQVPTEPVLFMKPATAVISDRATMWIPRYSRECHYEVELALLIGKTARAVTPEHAMEYLAGYGVAIDMTLRDVQERLKAMGLPWEVAKGFDGACPLSDFVEATKVTDPHGLTLRLSVNGEVRQNGTTADMILDVPQIIAHISNFFTLEPGDVILTGTPSGVGSVRPGESIEAEIATVGSLKIFVQSA
jgi:2-keto-4-pentenoate hydratase/2-oxohepta-3-ene-1,7-dioic acid hydratase in catechol pathway